MNSPETLLLNRGDVAALLNLDECIIAVEQAFKAHAEGRSLPPGVLGVHAQDGGFHIKAAGLELSRLYFAAKVNGNFMHNRERFGLPTIQGVIVLCDGANGTPLAVMDSMEITILRTGAATGLAAKYLARRDATTATICGCGNQGRVSLRALGIGATTAVFSVVDAWLLRPLPFKEPERLRGGRRRSIQQSLCGVVTDPGFDREAAQT